MPASSPPPEARCPKWRANHTHAQKEKPHLAVASGSEGSVHRWIRDVPSHIHAPDLVPVVILSRPSPRRTTACPLYVIVTSAGDLNGIVIIEVAATLCAMGAALIAEALSELFDGLDKGLQAMRGDFFLLRAQPQLPFSPSLQAKIPYAPSAPAALPSHVEALRRHLLCACWRRH